VAAGVDRADVERQLILGPGWLEKLESGSVPVPTDLLLALAHLSRTDLASLVEGIGVDHPATLRRALFATTTSTGIELHFAYGDYDASYALDGASIEEFEVVLSTLRDALASSSGKADAVTSAYLTAVRLWPSANPSDIWWFLLYRAYLDPFNHPASDARRNFHQSWVRTAGWALERVLVRHYADALRAHGVRIFIASAQEKLALLPRVDLARRLEADKVDVMLTGTINGLETFLGAVHVKASFAERRTDDVPLSEALIGAGYMSIFWTMDCKSAPSVSPVNRGELGAVLIGDTDKRSAKRRDFEVEGSFSACFSYNQRTERTPDDQTAAARVYRCTFANPNDEFVRFVVDGWRELYAAKSGV